MVFVLEPAMAGGALSSCVFSVAYVGILALVAVGAWKLYAKAGQPGWGALVPFYNIYLYCRICGRPGWWVILMLVPLVNVIISIVLASDMSRSFGRGLGTTVGLIVLPVIFIPILGLGDAQYRGPAAAM